MFTSSPLFSDEHNVSSANRNKTYEYPLVTQSERTPRLFVAKAYRDSAASNNL